MAPGHGRVYSRPGLPHLAAGGVVLLPTLGSGLTLGSFNKSSGSRRRVAHIELREAFVQEHEL